MNPPFELPFAISADKVDGKKMSFTFNRDSNWTYALKLMLTDLKLMLAWLSCKARKLADCVTRFSRR